MDSCKKLKAFSGKLTKDIRRRIQEKRQMLGLTYYQMALFFNTDWTTIRKWEMGPTECCSIAHRQRLQDFLNGAYDHEFTTRLMSLYDRTPSDVPPAIRGSMERIIHTYIICKGNERLKRRLQEDLEFTISETLRQLTRTPSEEYMNNHKEDML